MTSPPLNTPFSPEIAAIIVAYRPDAQLETLAYAVLAQVARLIVVDNTPGSSAVIDRLEQAGNPRLEIVQLGQNTGIAHALNVGIGHAAGCKFVLTLDQDSSLPEDYVTQMLEFYKAHQAEGELGLVAPNFLDVNSGTVATFTRLERFSMHSFSCSGNSGAYETTFAITSGSLIPRSVFEGIGGFDDRLFIDHVDTEFCLRLQQHGYRVLVNGAITIRHAIGKREKHRFLGLTFKPNNHRPLRRYYISRNGVVVALRYARDFPSFMALNALRMVHEVSCIVLYEQNKRAKLSAVVAGLWDGLRGRLGKWSQVVH